MKNVVNLVKENKVKVLITILIIIILFLGIYRFLDSKKKEYNLIEVSTYNYFVLNKDSKYGVINTKGEVIVEPKFDNVKIPNPEKAVFVCENEDKLIILNETGKEILNEYEEVNAISINGIVSNIPYEKTVLKYKKEGKYGIINYEGKIKTKPIYDEISGLENKESELLVKINGKYGVINAKGAQIIKPEYDSIIADGFYTDKDKYGLSGYIVSNKTKDGYRYGYINSNLKKVLNVEYNSVERLLDIKNTKDVCLIASKNGKYGVIKNNKELINLAYQGIEYDRTNSIFELERSEKYGIADYAGKTIIPVEYFGIEIKGIYIQAYKNEEESIFYNILGEQVADAKYNSILKTENENYYITINEDGFYGITNSNNEELVENKYNYIEYLFNDCFIVANEKGKLGVINSKGDTKLELKYDVLQKIDGTNVVEAKILKDKTSDIYSASLEVIYSVKNAFINKQDRFLKVYSEQENKYLDFNGKIIDTKEIFKNNLLFASKKDDKWGFIDRDGKVVVDYQYDKVTEFNEYGYAGIKVNDKWGVIDSSGKVVQEPIYEIMETNTEPEFLGQFYKVYYGYGESYYTDKTN